MFVDIFPKILIFSRPLYCPYLRSGRPVNVKPKGSTSIGFRLNHVFLPLTLPMTLTLIKLDKPTNSGFHIISLAYTISKCTSERALNFIQFEFTPFSHGRSLDFLPEASFGPRVLSLPASVCVCVRQSRVCPRDNLSPIKARITKLDRRCIRPWLRSILF